MEIKIQFSDMELRLIERALRIAAIHEQDEKTSQIFSFMAHKTLAAVSLNEAYSKNPTI